MSFPLVHRMAVLSWALATAVDSYYLFYGMDCFYLGSPEHTEFTLTLMYNKKKLATLNSTEGRLIGYNEIAEKWTKIFNNDTQWLNLQITRGIESCNNYVRLFAAADHTARPKVIVRSLRSASGDQPAMLMCSAHDFYPKPIKLTWLRNGKKVTGDVVFSEELYDGDWYYQIHSQLEYSPGPAEQITCMVEHLSFTQPALFHWQKGWTSVQVLELRS
ncbi:class II histocompatibility antigen, B-L beta chain-like isoform X2 [Astyanax mexicanus]|uniref:class II histocompatibility antigen, B-L beta chain-like isoform X2 n=1 Tax=Astyanax mexicanus TaxID=7994 RepID=UPI0020CAC533|nr:class II histocompatibility antigen, B-L beta chain-like isoform X2 [Astyanax mexicanus]